MGGAAEGAGHDDQEPGPPGPDGHTTSWTRATERSGNLDVSVLREVIATQHELAAVGLDLDAVMQRIADRTRELTDGTAAAVRLLDGDALVCGATSGAPEIGQPHRLPIAHNLAGHAMRSGRSLLCMDTETDDRVDTALSRRRNVRSIIAVPLLHAGESVGLLLLYGDRPGAFNERDIVMMEVLSVVLSAALAHAAEFEAKQDQVETLARFEATFANALTGMMLTDVSGRIIDSNPAIEQLLGRQHDELVGRRVVEFVTREDRRRTRAAFRRMVLGDAGSIRIQHRFVRPDGDVRWVDAYASIVRNAEWRKSFSVGVFQDVTERKAAEAALQSQAELNEYQALHDALTGLPNRRLFGDRVSQAVSAARRTGGSFAVLVTDLDGFKEVNDTLGHGTGDDLLVEVGARLRSVLRDVDTVSRLGGDEFGMLLSGSGRRAEVLRTVQRLTAAIEKPVVLQGVSLSLEASTGVAMYPNNGQDIDTLLQCADRAMYQAKAEKAGWAFYDASRPPQDAVGLALMAELRRALDQHELVLFYQPKARMADGEVHSVEALLRWQHPERGLVLPDGFIPAAQRTGLIKPLTLYVIDEALRQCRAWQDEGECLAIAVNLSAHNLLDSELPLLVGEMLARWDVEPGLLEFEITESAVLADPADTRSILEQFAATGIRLSIDDFGTGYSSMTHLKGLRVNEIKVDRSFVMNMQHDQGDATIVRSTIELACNLGLEVVAEGVENEQVWDQLRALGCTTAQGYYLSQPVPPTELIAWLLKHRGTLRSAQRRGAQASPRAQTRNRPSRSRTGTAQG